MARSGKWEFGLNNRWAVWLEVGNGSLVSTIGGGCGSKREVGVWSQQ